MRVITYLASIALSCCATVCVAQNDTTLTAANKLKSLSLEDLFNIQVTSVSKRSEKLSEVASAIQVITREDILRSGAVNLPEALRLVPNIQVAQIRGNAWIISSRGFNAPFSNKLLVMIDGRTVYSPLFAGVFWDAQSVLLEDVDRIEVISGPGGTLWGANAVNGVINIITKNAKSTKGLYLQSTNLVQDYAARYGGDIGSKVSYRAYIQHNGYDNTVTSTNADNFDSSLITQGGFRVDWDISAKENLSVHGDFYGGEERTRPNHSTMEGQNIVARWAKTISDRSEMALQVYYDRTARKDVPSTITDNMHTWDIDFQHGFTIGKANRILWGTGIRVVDDNTQNSTVIVGLLPKDRSLNLYTAFIQDEIMLAPEKWKLTIGSKIQQYTFSGFDLQPSARLTWTPNDINTLWSAVSRAIRAPSRIDVDYFLPTYPVPPTSLSVAGGPNFVSEKVIAYELGYRVRPSKNLSLSLSTFYNIYNDLYSVEALPGTFTYQIQNGGKGHSWGMEFAGNYQVFKAWRLRGGYTYVDKKLENKPGHTADYSALGIDPKNQFLLQSILNLPGNLQLDIVGRYVDSLPKSSATNGNAAYFTFDTRIAWSLKKFELSLAGKNLSKDHHAEFGSSYIQRRYYIRLLCRL